MPSPLAEAFFMGILNGCYETPSKRTFEFNFMKSLEAFPACFKLSFSHYGTP